MTPETPSPLEALGLAAFKAGGWIPLARALGVSHQAVYAWKRRGYAPPYRAMQIERLYDIRHQYLIDQRQLRWIEASA